MNLWALFEVCEMILLFSMATLGPGLLIVRRAKWSAPEKIAAAFGLSVTLIASAAFADFVLKMHTSSFQPIVLLAVLAFVFAWKDVRELWRDPEGRAVLKAYIAVAVWALGWAFIIRCYSGGGWKEDWYDQYDRVEFFKRHKAITTDFLGVPLPARAPLLNLFCVPFMTLIAAGFLQYQTLCALLGAGAVFPIYLFAKMVGGKRTVPMAALLAFFLFDPMLVQNLTYPWTKPLCAVLTATGVYFYLTGWRANDGWRVQLAFFLLGAGALTHYSVAPYVAAIGLHFVAICFFLKGQSLFGTERRSGVEWMAGAVTVLLLGAATAVWALREPIYALMRYLGEPNVDTAYSVALYVAAIGLHLVAIGIFLKGQSPERRSGVEWMAGAVTVLLLGAATVVWVSREPIYALMGYLVGPNVDTVFILQNILTVLGIPLVVVVADYLIIVYFLVPSVQKLLVAGLAATVPMLLWLWWCIVQFGAPVTFESTYAVERLPNVTLWEYVVIAVKNIFCTLIPFPLRNVSTTIFEEPVPWAHLRESAFLLYQTDLWFMFGAGGAVGLVYVIVYLSQRLDSPMRWFWGGLFAVGFAGICFHPFVDPYGLAHLTFQTQLLVGIGVLAGTWEEWPVLVQLLAILGMGLDFLLGIVLHIVFEGRMYGANVDGGLFPGLLEPTTISVQSNWDFRSKRHFIFLADSIGNARWVVLAGLAIGAYYLFRGIIRSARNAPVPDVEPPAQNDQPATT